MIVKSTHSDNSDYTVVFEETIGSETFSITVHFRESYSYYKRPSIEQLKENFGVEISSFGMEIATPYPLDVQNRLVTIPVHMPSKYARQMFQVCLDFFIDQTSSPIRISTADHPGYPLILLNYSKNGLDKCVMERLVRAIVDGIANCKHKKIESPNQEKTEEEDHLEEVFDTEDYVEYDFDDDVTEIMHQPVKERVEDLKEEEDD